MVYEPLYHALHIWPVYASVENWKLAEIFFAKDRLAPEEIVLILRILDNAISPGKQTKSHKSLFERLSKNT